MREFNNLFPCDLYGLAMLLGFFRLHLLFIFDTKYQDL